MQITNPYANATASWLKGALHLHSTNSDGKDSPRDAILDYERLGFDFAVVTDHNHAPSVADLHACRPDGAAHVQGPGSLDTRICVIPGVEYRGEGADSEIGILGIRTVPPRPTGIAAYHSAARESGGFCIYNHPTWHIHHWPVEHMLRLPPLHALEVYNALVDWLPGAAECCDKWDRLLTSGIRMWGVATDDAHETSQRSRGWVMVSAERNQESILAALRAGAFYSSSGVTLRTVSLDGNMLTVESDNAQEIRFFADRGAMRHRTAGSTATYELREDDIYVRAEAFGSGASKAWTNPLFVKTDRSRQLSEEFRTWYLRQTSRSPHV